MSNRYIPGNGEAWAITEAGLADYIQQVNILMAQVEAGTRTKVYDETVENDDHPSPFLRVAGSVGVISIRGPLLNVDNWITQMLGLSTYPAIQRALLQAVENPNIDRILLDIDSPGGHVAGCAATADLIYAIDHSVKPVFTSTDGNMLSAAYWLGCSAREIYCDKGAMLGSIGVLITHFDHSEQMKNIGIKATLIHSGKYKTVGNPYEPLSEEALTELQARSDATYKLFVEHVAEERRRSYEYTDKFMAQGRQFIGGDAKEVGLADKVSSFSASLADIAAKAVDSSTFPYKIAI